MKNITIGKIMETAAVMLVSAALLSGCAQQEESGDTAGNGQGISAGAESAGSISESDTGAQTAADTGMDIGMETGEGIEQEPGSTELEVRFGDGGEPFMMRLEDNETAAAIARYVGTSDWRLPIYERDEDADYDVMQYYDIPGRYEIPSDPETVTEEKAGEVYYSDPNRIVLFIMTQK